VVCASIHRNCFFLTEIKADVVKLTDEESEWLFGIPAAEAFKSPTLVQEHFPKAIGVLVTAGKKGAAYWLLGHTGSVPVFDVKITETTGGKIIC
jgi:fructokinase